MKKAFSLGEVLTTLTVIGVIAALILPAFMYGTSDSSLKKSRNAISKKLGDGFGAMRVDGALGETYANTTEFVEAMKSYFNIAKVCQKNEPERRRGTDRIFNSCSVLIHYNIQDKEYFIRQTYSSLKRCVILYSTHIFLVLYKTWKSQHLALVSHI